MNSYQKEHRWSKLEVEETTRFSASVENSLASFSLFSLFFLGIRTGGRKEVQNPFREIFATTCLQKSPLREIKRLLKSPFEVVARFGPT